MSAMPGTVVTIKTEVLSDVEAISSDDEESEVVTCGLPQTVLTTNYHDQRLPMLEDFLGPYKFTFQLPRDGSSIKPAWDYSDILKQVFIKVDRILVVQFSFNSSELNMKDIFIRAVLVYSSADHVYSPVNRCLVHAIEDDPLAKSHLRRGQCQCPMYNLAGHVVRCRSVEAIYCYDPKSERHSVLCPVKSTADLLYSFSCKNSCPKGMNRRGTKLVFTLENGSGKMLGRTSLDVKVCSCPRRDKEKLEGQILKNSVPQAEGNTSLPSCQPPAKVRRLMNVDTSSPSVGVKTPIKDIQADNVPGQRKEDEDELVIAEDDYLPGEVIMKIRSEIRNIRQVLNVAERRFSGVQGLLNDSLHS